jgi:VanZ family protein
MTFINQTKVKQVLLLLWASAIWIGSLLPIAAPPVANGDKFEHLFGYAVLAILGWRVWYRGLPVWLAAASMGVAVEFAQALTPWRSFDVADMLANALGAAIGIALCLLANKYRKSHP